MFLGYVFHLLFLHIFQLFLPIASISLMDFCVSVSYSHLVILTCEINPATPPLLVTGNYIGNWFFTIQFAI